MITMQEWKVMNGREKTLFLEDNFPVNGRGKPRRPVNGIGENNAPYITGTRIDGNMIVDPAYQAWTSMLTRAYSAKYHDKWPTYVGVTVCEEWRKFMSFRMWWKGSQVDGWHLDKDLLSDSREYSPEACLFIPSWLNTFTIDRGAARGEFPIGLYYDKKSGKYDARCGNPITMKQEFIGLFTTPEAAHLAWRARKMELALELKPKMDEIDQRIYPRVVEIINNAK